MIGRSREGARAFVIDFKLTKLEHSMTIKLGGMLVVAVGIVAVLVKLL